MFFLSQLEAEKLLPIPGTAMISITVSDKPTAKIVGWNNLYRDAFYGGGYSQPTITTMKSSFEHNGTFFIDSTQASFGEFRSDAIGLFLCNKHGFTPSKPTRKQNIVA